MVSCFRDDRGWLMTELMVALAILVGTLLPLAGAFVYEQQMCRRYYHEAVAMEIVDGEMEILAAGEWRAFGEGTHPYPVTAAAAANLPPGKFILTVTGQRVRLEWQPRTGKRIAREVNAR